MWAYQFILYINSPVNGQLFFQFLALTNKAAVNTHVQVYIYVCMFFFLLNKSLGVEWLNHMVGVCLTSSETAKLFPKQLHHGNQPNPFIF